MSWIDKIKPDITEKLEEFQIKLLSVDELENIMPDVIKFYNHPSKDQDVYRLENDQCILLLTTPPKITGKDKNGKEITLNRPKLCSNGAYMLWCNILIYGEAISSGVFASKEQWREIGSFDSKAFVKGKLNIKYKMLSDQGYAVLLDQFLKDNELKSLDDVDESDYLIKYSVNVQQVIK